MSSKQATFDAVVPALHPPPAHVADDEEIDDEPVRQIFVPASGQPMPRTVAPASVWEVAKISAVKLREQGRFGEAACFYAPDCGLVVRDGDVVRHIARRREQTEAWAEKERVRRAKQRPPHAPRQHFKLKNSRPFADESAAGLMRPAAATARGTPVPSIDTTS